MKLIFILFAWLVTTSLYSQIAINTESPQSIFHVDSQGNTVGATNISDDVVISDKGYVGVGTTAPSTQLDVRGLPSQTLRIVDGMQKDGKVLISDADGVGTWKVPINGVLVNGTVFDEKLQLDTAWVRTQSYIEIPPNTSCIISCMTQFCRLSSVDDKSRQVAVYLGLSTSNTTFTNASKTGQVIQSMQYTFNKNCFMTNGFISDIKNDSDTDSLTLYLYAKTDQTDQAIYYNPDDPNNIRLFTILFK